LRAVVSGSRHSDEETRGAIREVYEKHGYILDPHTAVGYLGLRRWRQGPRRREQMGEEVPGVVLATAHPAKFREEIEATLGIGGIGGTGLEIPERLARYLELPGKSIPIQPRLEELAAALRD